MHLIACRLHNVRRHRELALRFGRQLTLIEGANETGKSTLVEALHKGLFLRATATGRGVEELRSRLHPGLPDVEISFAAQGEIWRLRKRFAGSSGTCQLSDSKGLALNGAAAEEHLARLLGFEAPVEGRRIAQLPERWAHLWVRQGDAGLNPLGGNQERYDHNRLVEQLQLQGSSSALESTLDRLVMEQIQQQVAELYTATGRVKAGSALAEAQRRCKDAEASFRSAQQQLAELETAMEQWRSINGRLETIEGQQRPAVQRELELQQQITLLETQLAPLLRQEQERQQLEQQQRQEREEQTQLQGRLNTLSQEHAQQRTKHQELEQKALQLSAQLHQQAQRQELIQVLLDRQQLEGEALQLQSYKEQLQRLQEQAETLKQQLAALPTITADHVRQWRQAEQAHSQATARCDAMASSLEVLACDQAIQLNGEPLNQGERRQISAAAELRVGAGVEIAITPGGGQALPQALEQLRRCEQQLSELQATFKLNNSDEAEAIERERQGLEQELANLRQTAKAIPWPGLEQRLEQLQPRRQRLELALRHQQPLLKAMAEEQGGCNPIELEPTALHDWQETLRSTTNALVAEQEQIQGLRHVLEQAQQRSESSLQQLRSRGGQLEGSLQVLGQRLQSLSQERPTNRSIEAQQQHLMALQAELHQLASSRGDQDPAACLQALEQEKDQLLSQRGQTEQRCQSLGAINPVAELEQRQAAWDEVNAEVQRLEERGNALRLLLERFYREQSHLASRYSEPLRIAITPYLAEFATDPHQPLLAFDPQEGFHDLQLRQGDEAFAFERLSGGMREQLSASVRLAMAQVLKPAYDDALPLVFDDAFTNSDRERLEGLQRMLLRGMEQGLQIVLLTCHGDNYRSLPQQHRGPSNKNPSESLGGINESQENQCDRVVVELS